MYSIRSHPFTTVNAATAQMSDHRGRPSGVVCAMTVADEARKIEVRPSKDGLALHCGIR